VANSAAVAAKLPDAVSVTDTCHELLVSGASIERIEERCATATPEHALAMLPRSPTDPDVGFDIAQARQRLGAWLVQKGVSVPPPGTNEAGKSSDELAWQQAFKLAMVHAGQHGIPTMIAGAPAPRCNAEPCNIAGVSFALLELATFALESMEVPNLTGDVAELASKMNDLAPLLSRVRGAIEQVKSDAPFAQFTPPGNALVPQWGEYLGLVGTLEGAGDKLAAAQEELRNYFLSPLLRNPPAPGRGRNPQLLLTAVWQHLARGGLKWSQIADLVPDAIPGDRAALRDRIRKRAQSPDCRTMEPWQSELDAS
jgi:hypothetical protein